METARNIGFDAEEVETFLGFIVAPPQLICGRYVLENCRSVLDRLSLFVKLEPKYSAIISQDQITAWAWSLKLLTESDPNGFNEIEGFNQQVTFGKRPPLRKYLKNHPLYAFLCHSVPEKNKKSLLTCQALGALVDARLRNAEKEKNRDYSGLRYKFILDLRKLVERGNGRELLASFPEEPLKLSDYIEKISLIDKNNELLVPILYRLRHELKNVLPTKKGSYQRSHAGGSYVTAEVGYTTGNKDEQANTYLIKGLTSYPEAVLEAFRKDSGSTKELESGHSLIIAITDGVVALDDGSAKRQRAHAVRGYRNRIAMLNQLLPSQKPGLSVWETAKLITYIYPPAEVQEQPQILSEEVQLALGLMLWGSVELEHLTSLKYYSEDHYRKLLSSSKAVAPGLMIRSNKLYAVVLPATASVHHTNPDQLKHLLVPLPELLNELWKKYKPNRVLSGQAIFSRGNDGIITKVKEALSDIRKREMGDYTPSRISRHLFHLSLTMPTGDITAPMFWSGQNHYLGGVVAHYTRYSVSALCEHYEKSCLELMLQVGDDLAHMGWGHSPKRLLTVFSRRIEQRGFVGTPFCPDVDRLNNIFSKLKADINQCRPIRKDRLFPAELYKLHNPYTLYTMLGIALVSGARVIDKAVKLPATVHTDTGFAVINEKNSVDYFNSRLIWLPSAIQQQYRNYLTHLNNIYQWLCIVDQEKALSLKASLTSENIKCKVPPAWLFLLDDANTVIPAKSTDMIKKLGEYGFDFKSNALRHLLRTRAVKEKVPTEIINAQLGHWENGQSPWEKWSFLSTVKMKEKLRPVQEGLLAEVNFQSLEGIGARREKLDDLERMENSQAGEQISLF